MWRICSASAPHEAPQAVEILMHPSYVGWYSWARKGLRRRKKQEKEGKNQGNKMKGRKFPNVTHQKEEKGDLSLSTDAM